MRLLSGKSTSVLAPLSGLGIAEAISRFSAWVGFVYLVQILPPDQYGLLGVAAAGVNLLIPFVDIGWSAIGSREAASRPDVARRWLTAVTSRRSVVAFFLFLLASMVASQLTDPILSGLIVGHAFFLFVGALTPDWYLAARERFGLLASARVLQSIAYVVMLMLVVRGPEQILLQPLVGVACYGLAMLLMLFGVERKTQNSTHVRISGGESTLAFFGTYMLQNVVNVSLLAVGIFAGSDAAGVFNVGVRFWLLGGVVAALPSLVVGPRIARADESSSGLSIASRLLFRLSFATSVAVILGGLLWAPLLVRLVAPVAYQNASPIVAVLLIGIGFQTLSLSSLRTLVLRRRTPVAVTAQITGAMVGIVVLAATLRPAGPMAGAISCVAAEMTTALLATRRLEREQRMDARAWRLLVPDVSLIVLASVLLVGVRSMLDPPDGAMAGLITLTTAGAWLWSMRPRPDEEYGDRAKPGRRVSMSVVLVSWNNGPWTLRCVRALVSCGIRSRRITVVETGRDPAALRQLRTLPSGVKIVRRPDNPGYGAAVNAGVASAPRSDAILILNADVEVTSDGMAALTRGLTMNPRAGCVTVRTHDDHGVDSTHLRRTTPLRLAAMIAFPGLWRRFRWLIRPAGRRGIQEVRFAEGSALLVRRSAWDDVGGFDERFRFFGEDADLSIRLRKAGWRIYHDDSTSMLHVGGTSFATAKIDPLLLMAEGILLWTMSHAPGRVRWTRRFLSASFWWRDRWSAESARGSDRGSRAAALRAPTATTGGGPESPSAGSTSRLTVLIPTFDRRQSLRRCLAALGPQTSPDTEVIVIHQGRPKRQQHRLVQALSLRRSHRGRAKNAGVRASKGSILLFCDDDIVPPPGLLSAHRGFHRGNQQVAVTCRMEEPVPTIDRRGGPILTISRWGRVHTRFNHGSRVRTGYAATGNMSVMRTTFAASGGFDEAYRGTGVFEDADLGERLRGMGVQSWLEPHPVVLHEPQIGGNHTERERCPARYYCLFHHNLSYFFLKNRPLWQWLLAAFVAAARSIRHAWHLPHPIHSAVRMFRGFLAGRHTYQSLTRS